MTRNGGPDESATQVISTSGGGAGQNEPRGQNGPKGPETPPRGAPQRPDLRRPQPQRYTDPVAIRERNGLRQRVMSAPQQPAADPRNRVRRARLRAVRLDPWSVMKTAFLLSIAFAIVTVVAVTVVWYVLQAAGVYESISRTVTDVLGSASETRFNLEDYIGLQRVLGFTALICVVDVVLITAISTLCAFLYNLSASLLGGLEVTLAEEE